MYHVSAKDEWCAEAYMETNYDSLQKHSFVTDLCKYSTFLIRNNDYYIPKTYTNIPLTNYEINLNAPKWGWFNLVPDLFLFSKGTRLTKADSIEGDIPLVTAGENNQGVSRFVDNDMKIFSHCITIDMFGFCAYRGYEFCCDDNILVLKPNNIMSKYVMMFIVTIINQDQYKYAYGRQYRQKTLLKHQIKLPIDSNGNPDWAFMEQYIMSLPYSANL